MLKIPRIKLVMELSRGYDRGLLRGISSYAHLHGPWSFAYETPSDSVRMNAGKIKKRTYDGIIAHVSTRKKIEKIINTGIPAIVQGNIEIYEDIPTIIGNDELIGKIGVEHFIERGFQNLAFFGDDSMYWSRIRCRAFCQYGNQKQNTVFTFCSKEIQKKNDKLSAIIDWLTNLPKPIGIMACNDDYAQDLMEACIAEEIRIPEKVAILGVDNDDLICQFSEIPLSSIAYNSEKAGYEAATLLDSMMHGRKISNQKIYIEPLYVVTRRSTDTIAIEDSAVSAGIHFIRYHIKERFSVEDVTAAMMLSRRTAELKFKQVLGRTIFEEILDHRVQLICKFLLESNLTISEIASKFGFATAYMIATFKKQMHMTPKEYRTKHRH